MASHRLVQQVSRLGERVNGRRQLAADLALLLVALVWGSTFVIVKEAVAAFPVLTFLALRFGFAALALLPLILWRRGDRAGRVAPGKQTDPGLAASLLIGAALVAGFAFQTFGLQLTTPAKTGFITGLSVVMVPVISALLLRKSPSLNAWFGVGLATVGLALLTLQADLGIATGDLLVFGCALAFAGHILLVGHFAQRVDPLTLTVGQIVVVAVVSGATGLLIESPPPLTGQVLFAALFTGLLATAAAFGAQTVAQRFTTATHTALIFAMEPVFAALFSLLLIGELLGPRQVIGCCLILAGMLVAETRIGQKIKNGRQPNG